MLLLTARGDLAWEIPLADSWDLLEAAMAIILYKSITGYRQRRRAAAAVAGGQFLSPDDPPSAQQNRPGTASYSKPQTGSPVS